MTKIRLATGEIITCEDVELMYGVLKISTKEKTVEELAALFSDKEKTSCITLLTESGKEAGFKVGFTTFAGIQYGADGIKTIEMAQPADVTEARLSSAAGEAAAAVAMAEHAATEAQEAREKADTVQTSLDTAITELTMALAATAQETTGEIVGEEEKKDV